MNQASQLSFLHPRQVFELAQTLDGKPSLAIVTNGRYCRETGTTDIFIDLKTGRYQQIRRHLAAISHPLVGERRYGRMMAALHLSALFQGTGKQ